MKKTIIGPEKFTLGNSELETKIDPTSLHIYEVLNELTNSDSEVLIIFADVTIGEYSLGGIDLVKHIRLTPSLGEIFKKPIVLLHWLPLGKYIELNKENILLYSPGIYSFQLPCTSIDFERLKPLNTSLKPYLFNLESDEQTSEHVSRNIEAIEQFKQEVNNQLNYIEKSIEYKKIVYNLDLKNSSVKTFDKILNILLVDDMSSEWEPVLRSFSPYSNFSSCRNIVELEYLIKSNKKSNSELNEILKQNLTELKSKSSGLNDENYKLKQLNTDFKNAKLELNLSESNIEKYKTELTSLLQLVNEMKNEVLSGAITDIMDTSGVPIDNNKKQQLTNYLIKLNDLEILKTKIKNTELTITNLNEKIPDFEIRIPLLEKSIIAYNNKCNELKTSVKNQLKQVQSNSIDLILLDTHLTPESESKPMNESDGVKVLEILNQNNLSIPTLIFSATTKKLDSLYSEYLFLNTDRFIKGITPPSELSKSLYISYNNKTCNQIVQLIDFIMEYPDLKYREYSALNSPIFVLKHFSISHSELIEKFQLVKLLIQLYARNEFKNLLLQSVYTLGDIQKDFVFKIKSEKKSASLFHNSKLETNKIAHKSEELNFFRNKIAHKPTDDKETKRFEDLKSVLSVVEIKSYIDLLFNYMIEVN